MSQKSPRYGARLLKWIQGNPQNWGHDPAQLDFAYVRQAAQQVGKIYGENRYFDLSVSGWEHLPPPPVMIVSNHSGGTLIPDVWGLFYAWLEHFGEERIVHPLAHDMVFAAEGTARSFGKLGVLRANPRNARMVLEEWRRDLFVCPGGDRDTWRPWKDRYKVNFSGRRGYAKIALMTGTPVVPVANAGAHETLMVLTDGARIARTFRFQKYFRAEVFPVHLSVPWGLAVGPWPHWPMPAHFRYRLGPPIPVGPAVANPSEQQILDLDALVQQKIQVLLDQLREEQPKLQERVRRVYRVVRRGVRGMRRN